MADYTASAGRNQKCAGDSDCAAISASKHGSGQLCITSDIPILDKS